jgi:hypothetical protein
VDQHLPGQHVPDHGKDHGAVHGLQEAGRYDGRPTVGNQFDAILSGIKTLEGQVEILSAKGDGLLEGDA